MPDTLEVLGEYRALTEAAEQRRLGVGLTAAYGKSCFRGLLSGRYQLQSSGDGGWNSTQMRVVIAKQYGQKQKIEGSQSLGI